MTDNKPRDEADKDAGRPAERPMTAAEKSKAAQKTAEESAKEQAKRAEIDKEFQDDVAKAAEKRTKALSKLSPKARGGNIAEIAWNDTKADEDPDFGSVDATHREKLNYVVQTIRETGNADVVGLEAFEERVKELLDEEKEAEGTPSKVPAKAKENAEKGK